MAMKDWVEKLDDLLRLNEKEILRHKGSISKKLADEKAEKEFSSQSLQAKHDRATSARLQKPACISVD